MKKELKKPIVKTDKMANLYWTENGNCGCGSRC